MAVLKLIHYISIKLDSYWDWHRKPIARLLLQVVFGFILVLYLDLILVRGFFYLFDADFESSGYMLVEFPKIKWMLGTMNFLYWIKAMSPGLLSLKHFRNDAESSPELTYADDEQEVTNTSALGTGIESIIGKLGNKTKQIRLDDIACIKCESRSGYVYLKNNAVFNIDYRTKDLMDVLDPKRFYQTNRGIIFSFDVIESYRRDKKEGLLILKEEINPEVSKIISRDRFREFKAAFEAKL